MVETYPNYHKWFHIAPAWTIKRPVWQMSIRNAKMSNNWTEFEDGFHLKRNTILLLKSICFANSVCTKTDCYEKDPLFVASFVFCVITFEPIMI